MSSSPAGCRRPGAIDRIKGSGAKLICFAPALALAKKLIRSGVDALVIEGMEAGGHIGPVSTSVLAQEILPPLSAEMPIFVAGGIGHGGLIAGYLEMGAVGVQLGTRFVCAHECIAHPNFKKAFIRASARDAITIVQIDPRLPVIPVRALKNREMESFAAKQREVAELLDEGEVEMAEAQLQIEHYWAGALRRAVIEGDVETGSVMAGQSVGMVKRGGVGRRHPSASWSTRPRTRSSGGRCTHDRDSAARTFLMGAAALAVGTQRKGGSDGAMTEMFGLIGRMRATPGQRDALIAILLEGTGGMPGCLSYIVARDPADADAIWITEVWDSRESHRASLQLPQVQAAIARARPLVAGFDNGHETVPVGGIGLPARRN